MITLEAADIIEGDASLANAVDYTINGVEVDSSRNVDVKALADGQLAATKGALYTTPGSATAIIRSIILVNTDSSARTVNLYVQRDGSNSRRIIPEDLSLEADGGSLVFSDKLYVYDAAGRLLYVGNTGATGAQGPFGGDSFGYRFSASTADSDPGAGYLRYNNATPGSVTEIYIDDTDGNSVDIQVWLRTLDNSTSTIKGRLHVFKETDSSVFAVFDVTSLTEATGYFKIAVTHIVSNSTFSADDEVVVTFVPTGDKGDTGDTGATGATGPAPAGQIFLSCAGCWPSTTNGCSEPFKQEFPTNDVDDYYMAFDKDTDEYGQGGLIMPSDWDGGTITAVPLWTCASGVGAAGKTVCWGLQCRCSADGDAIDQAWGTEETSTDTWQADEDDHYGPATPAITPSGNAGAGRKLRFRFRRVTASDDLGGDAWLNGWMITFTRS